MNKQIILNERPVGVANESTWRTEQTDVPHAEEGQIVVKIDYVSLDPAMRGWLNDAKSYIAPVGIGDVMRSSGVGQIIESKNEKFQVGDYVVGGSGVQQYCAVDVAGWVKVDPNLLPLPKYLGVLGMPGFTAYFGLLEVGLPKEGETVLVSGAAGAVGSVVGQIAKIKGCRVVGIAGGKEKCKYVVDSLGFDACIDYKSENVYKGIRQHCPSGIDIYFDNVGGDILDVALTQINRGARIPICGAISQYNSTDRPKGPSNYLSLLVNSARMEGFVVFHFIHKYGQAAADIGKWVAEGKIKSLEHVEEGIENFLPTYEKLFSGEKRGKLVLKVSE
ncbi:MAG: NADPH-dependent curcumin reductase CurA [Saprospiraceae bacterium]|jgi:NADPH-dependent curcumin reductase CurA